MLEGNTLAVIGLSVAVVQLVVTLAGGLVFAIRLEGKINVQTVRIAAVETATTTFASVVTKTAVQDEKIMALDRTIEGLRRGEGYIAGHRKSVDGGYGSG